MRVRAYRLAMTALPKYVIAEVGADGRPVKYLPPLGLRELPGTVYRLTGDLGRAWKFVDEQAAAEYADTLNVSNPGSSLRAIKLPSAGQI